MTDTNTALAKPKSRDAAKIEKKFKSLTADCAEYRRKHNGDTTPECAAHQEGQFSLIKKNVESELGRRLNGQPFDAINDPEFRKKIVEKDNEFKPRTLPQPMVPAEKKD